MKFRKFGQAMLFTALSAGMVFSLTSCVQSFTVGYLYVTGTVTSTPSGNGIISGFKIDNNVGKLTAMHGFPVATGGANPIRAVLPTGSRFLYVLNQGTTAGGSANCTLADPCSNANITQFVVGGNGILTPQETFFSQGINPFRMVTDTSGKYIFVLDRYAPSNAYCSEVGTATCGDITAFSIDGTTGRLQLITNAQITSSTGNSVPYFPVPPNPVDFLLTTNYIFTVTGAAGTPQTVYPYNYSALSGQLTVSQNGVQQLTNGSGAPAEAITAIVNGNGTVYILDNESISVTSGGTTTTSPSQILPYTVGTNGALAQATGGVFADDPTLSNPSWLLVESKSKYLYVSNQGTLANTTDAQSGIAAYVLNNNAQPTLLAGEPFGTGSGPQCLVEDPSDQYIYTANYNDSTITGLKLDPNSGVLNQLAKGSSFPLTGPATWCLVDGRTD